MDPQGLLAWTHMGTNHILQDSRLTGVGSLKLVGLVELKVPVEWKMGAANSFHSLPDLRGAGYVVAFQFLSVCVYVCVCLCVCVSVRPGI